MVASGQAATATQGGTPTAGTPQASATPTATSVPVLISGQVLLSPNNTLDLNSNTVNGGVSDLQYSGSDANNLTITPMGNAKFKVFGQSPPSYANCKAAALSGAAFSLKDLKGYYLCYQTNQGLYGYMYMNNLNNHTLVLTVNTLTWSVP